jgi:hypothetical protein
MGNANKRGTFEERKASAISKREAAFIEEMEQRRQKRLLMTPEDKHRLHESQKKMLYLMSITIA